MPEQARLDVRDAQRLPEQRVILQIDLAHAEVVGGAPVGVHRLELLFGRRLRHRGFR